MRVSVMEFKESEIDKQKKEEFHLPVFMKKQMQVKRMMQADLIESIDELIEAVSSNSKRINHLKKEIIKDDITDLDKHQYEIAIIQYKNLSALANNVSEIYLMLLDIYTYGTYCLLAKDEWDWRAFARHICTILYEHQNTVNKQLNDILKILKTEMEKTYDQTKLVRAKKDFSSFINNNSVSTKLIVSGHFRPYCVLYM